MTMDNGGPERIEKKEFKHKTLSAYYPHLSTLHDYLLTAPRSSTTSIIQETDTDEYKRLVLETVCATRSTPVNLPSKGDVWGTQQEIVDRVLGEVSRRCAREGIKDVLISSDKVSCFAHLRMKSAEGIVRIRRSPYQYICRGTGYDPRRSSCNTPIKTMADPPFEVSSQSPIHWSKLRLMVRIGDDAFRYILLHTSLFLPVQNNCFMQLSGEPVYERYQHRPSQVVEQSTRDIPRQSTGRRKKKNKPALDIPDTKALSKKSNISR
jgi:hypothetical protein